MAAAKVADFSTNISKMLWKKKINIFLYFKTLDVCSFTGTFTMTLNQPLYLS